MVHVVLEAEKVLGSAICKLENEVSSGVIQSKSESLRLAERTMV